MRTQEKRQTRLSPQQRRELDETGYVVLPDVLTPDECDRLSQGIDDMWESERDRDHKYTKESGVQFTDNLLRYSTLFERCVTDPLVLDGVRAVLGDDIHLYLINGRRADPGFGNQALHDLNRRRGKPFHWCNTIWCLDEFTPGNGTRVIPGSHLASEPYLSRCEDPNETHPDETIAAAPRGSVIIFNSHLIHGGSTNREKAPRRCIHSSYAIRAERPNYTWPNLPEHIIAGLTPQALELLDLGPTSSGGRE